MSYNNTNYGYFNVPKTVGVEKAATDVFAGQGFNSVVSTYGGQATTSAGKVGIGIKNTYILPSVLNYALTTPPTYTPPPYIPPLTKQNYTTLSVATNASTAGMTYGVKSISPQVKTTESSQREVIQGTVTQLFSNFGFIDDNIIFSKSDILGPMVKVGDKVTVDVTLQPNSSTKYKGERVCKLDINPFVKPTLSQMPVIQQQSVTSIETIPNSIKNNKNSVAIVSKPSNNIRSTFLSNSLRLSPLNKRLDKQSKLLDRLSENLSPMKRSIENKYTASTKEKTSDLKDKSNEIKSKPFDSKTKSNDSKNKDEDQNKDYKAKRSRSKRSKMSYTSDVEKSSPIKFQNSTKSHSRKRSSDSKAKCNLKNYESFAFRELDCAAIKNQCRTLTLPSELFHISLKYQQSYPLNHPMKLGYNCHFKILDKRVEPIDCFTCEQLNMNINPQDADTTFIAKVMLLSTDDLANFYKDTLSFAEEFDSDNKIPITKAIKFLIGSMGEDREFGIGGAWSPSLDGSNPESNPEVLINTAIRTCKTLTGIDLSNCSSWPKFLELHYYRPLQKVNKKNVNGDIVIDLEAPEEWREPRMETVVYFIPDVWNIVPDENSWKEIKRGYEDHLARLMCPPPNASNTKISSDSQRINSATSSSTEATSQTSKVREPLEDQEEEDYSFNDTDDIEDKTISSTRELNLEDQPTHFSKLALVTMKIVDIKRELELRKLNNKGVMDQLKARLKSALEKEENEEKTKVIPVVIKETQVVTTTKDSPLSSNERNELKKLYILPDRPEIIVHQNRKFKHMKMRTMSLHSLLSYYNIKLEESTFELAIFAKQFLDMLRRDAVFNIYKSIVVAADVDLQNKEGSAKKAKLMVTTSKRTVNRPLLFSCYLLDREKTNKICLDDLRILIDGLGICLSSDQLSEVLKKVNDSKYLYYRQLTDKEMTDVDINNIMNTEISEDFDYIKELALGNKALFEDEITLTDTMINNEDVDRLRNELDKSERCRQILELKIAEIKEETKRSSTLSKTQAKDILKLKNQEAEYRNKYRSEKNRGDRYKNDFDKLFQQLKDVDKKTSDVNKFVSNVVVKFTKNTDKDKSSQSADSKKKSHKSFSNKSHNREESYSDLMHENDKLDECYDFELREVIEIDDEIGNSNSEHIESTMDNDNNNTESSMTEKVNEDDDLEVIGDDNNELEDNDEGDDFEAANECDDFEAANECDFAKVDDIDSNNVQCYDIEENEEKSNDIEADVEQYHVIEADEEKCDDIEANEEQCHVIEIDEDQCHVIETDEDQCHVIETDEDQCHVIETDEDQCHVIETDEDQCHVIETDEDQCHVIETDEDKCHVIVAGEEQCHIIEAGEEQCHDIRLEETFPDNMVNKINYNENIMNVEESISYADDVPMENEDMVENDSETPVDMVENDSETPVDITEVGMRIMEDPGMVILEDISLI